MRGEQARKEKSRLEEKESNLEGGNAGLREKRAHRPSRAGIRRSKTGKAERRIFSSLPV